MQAFAIILAAIAIVAVVLILFNFRFLLYPVLPASNPMKDAKHLRLEGPVALFISDLHLVANRPFEYSDALRRVLMDRQVSNLIVVGDLFDSPADGKMITGDTRLPIVDILGMRNLPIKGFFIEGSPPHDPSSTDMAALNIAPLVQLGRCAVFECNKVTVIAYHGHDLSRKGAIGHGWNRFISGLSLESAWKKVAGVPESDWVIFGHTHIPGIDAKHRVANCGGWQSIPPLVRPARTGLLFSTETDSLEIINFARQL